ncbi:hypothetical protein EDD36DRAFT_311697 [Exophiala viscosa]|uniref:Uncharacterized protein n=1 Tax=Exophiala viscosa TaxID=2486360 RepID=A0AAN6DRT7_9EURO|nr:hypothetical protein EDD36DRAFT_311697 [Exophiala viscosa]
MARITPLRILLLSPLFYLGLILLWVGLPSPNASWSDEASGHLWRGGSVTRVYDIDDFFSWNDPLPSVHDARGTGRRSFAVEYSYARGTSQFFVGSGRSAHSFNLTALLSSSSSVSILEVFTVRCKTGDEDGIDLPWFTQADATLLFWEIHRNVAYVPLRLRVVQHDEKRAVEVLAQSSVLEANHDSPDVVPLLTLTFDAAVSQQNGQDQIAFHAHFPKDPRNSSPSRTFDVRRAISAILVPTWFFIEAVMNVIGAPIFFIVQIILFALTLLGCYVVLVLGYWKREGSPAFWPWARNFLLTSRIAVYLEPKLTARPGEAQKDSGDDGSGDEGEDSDRGQQGPQPLTSVWAFFRSSSPLDDLFVTFEITRGLVQPLSLTRRQERVGDEESRLEHGSSTGIEGRDGGKEISTTTRTGSADNGEKSSGTSL